MTGPGAGAEHGLVRAPEPPVTAGEHELHHGPTGVLETRPSGGPRSILRSALTAVAGVLIGVAAVLLTRNGIHTDDFPPFLAGASATPITRYSGPWLTAGAAAALIAALLLLLSVIDGFRWLRRRRSATAPYAPARFSADVIGPTPS